MENKLIKILKSLGNIIVPDEEFKKRSRRLILAIEKQSHHIQSVKTRFWESLKFSGALAMATFLIFVIFGGLAVFKIKNLSPAVLTSFNEDNLLTESEEVDFQIELREIRYYERSAQEVAALFDEVLETDDSL
jgi:hypothetical protein